MHCCNRLSGRRTRQPRRADSHLLHRTSQRFITRLHLDINLPSPVIRFFRLFFFRCYAGIGFKRRFWFLILCSISSFFLFMPAFLTGTWRSSINKRDFSIGRKGNGIDFIHGLLH